MIEVEGALKARSEPAKDVAELLERLEHSIGRVLKVTFAAKDETYYHNYREGYTVIGELHRLRLTEGSSSVKARIGTDSEKLKLSSEISVLTDGQWVSIHAPGKKKKAKKDTEPNFDDYRSEPGFMQ